MTQKLLDPKMIKIQETLKKLTPDEQAFARAFAEMKLELGHLRQAFAATSSAYEDLYKLVLVLVLCAPEKELRVHESQFSRFTTEYRIETSFDETTREAVYKIKTFTDD